MKSQLIFQLKPTEKEMLKIISRKLGLSMSAFVRLAVFKKLRKEKLLLKSSKVQEVGDNVG